VVGPVEGNVDGKVAEDMHAARPGVRTQRLPFALEPDLVVHVPAVVEPGADPVGVRLAKRAGVRA
jgi:hypothetical protein